MEGTSQTEFPPCQLVEETIGKGDSVEKSKDLRMRNYHKEV
jgi:hypothetical protein